MFDTELTNLLSQAVIRITSYNVCYTKLLRMLSMDSFLRVLAQVPEERAASSEPDSRRNPFAGFSELPTFSEAAAFLVTEAMDRAGGNQTIAARLLGISQPALNKRLKSIRN